MMATEEAQAIEQLHEEFRRRVIETRFHTERRRGEHSTLQPRGERSAQVAPERRLAEGRRRRAQSASGGRLVSRTWQRGFNTGSLFANCPDG